MLRKKYLPKILTLKTSSFNAALKPPQNVVKDLLNLDLSLYWEPPDDASNLTTYTVAFREKKA